MLRAVTST